MEPDASSQDMTPTMRRPGGPRYEVVRKALTLSKRLA
jgi:hypothetical protein